MTVKKKFNLKDIKIGDNRNHYVEYYLYYEDSDDIDPNYKPKEEIKNSNSICFANLLYEIKKYGVNRIRYSIKDKFRHNLTDEEKLEWTKIAKRNLALPDYVTEESVLKNEPVLKIVDISPSLLYVYLSSLRVMKENPWFVRAMIYMVSGCRMDFCLAWVIASKLIITNSWHNIVQVGINQYEPKSEQTKINISSVIGLKRYLANPSKYDKRKLTSDRFNCHNTISSICKLERYMDMNEIPNSNLTKAIRSKTDKTALKYINNIK